MAKNFTDDEIIILMQNPYISKISTSTITYTSEFRELFVNEYQNGKAPSQILMNAGFDCKILGKDRIDNLTRRFKKMANREDGLVDTRKGHSGRPATKDLTSEEEIQRLKQKVKYLEQENTFLKKIKFIDKKAQYAHDRKKNLKSF